MKQFWQLVCLGLLTSAGAHAQVDGEFLGTVDYKGGFLREARISVKSAQPIRYFRLAIPSYCENLEVLEVSTVTENVKQEAKLVKSATNLYAVRGSEGNWISAILISLNGPKATECTIPVFEEKGTLPGGPIVEPNPTLPTQRVYQLCNRTISNVWASIAYENGTEMISEGWLPLGPGQCAYPKISTVRVPSVIYSHAYSDTGRQWGIGTNFCVNPAKNFKTNAIECQTTLSGYQWRQFSRHELYSFASMMRIEFI